MKAAKIRRGKAMTRNVASAKGINEKAWRNSDSMAGERIVIGCIRLMKAQSMKAA